MKDIKQELFKGERMLFKESNLRIYDSVFADRKSLLKESSNQILYIKSI